MGEFFSLFFPTKVKKNLPLGHFLVTFKGMDQDKMTIKAMDALLIPAAEQPKYLGRLES